MTLIAEVLLFEPAAHLNKQKEHKFSISDLADLALQALVMWTTMNASCKLLGNMLTQ